MNSASVPDGAVVDAHFHVWNLNDLHWLAGPVQPRIFGDYSRMQRDYTIAEYLGDITSANVVKSVYVQTNWPPQNALREVEWVQSVADDFGRPQAIVGFADLASPDLHQLITAQLRCPNLRGLRQQLFWHDNPAYRFAPRPDLMNDPEWRRGLSIVEQHGLVFELQVFASQMRDAAALARAFPGVQFVLVHAGMLEDTSPDGWVRWREGMSELADAPNVCVKLSGLNTFTRRLSPELIAAIVRDTLGLFGAGRCMFGSNFPIEKMWTDYESLLGAMRQALAHLPPGDQRSVLHDTAVRVYKLR